MTSELRIRTPEGVLFAYPLAGPITRCLACLIDIVCSGLISSVLVRIVRFFALIDPDLAAGLQLIVYFVVSVGYAIAFEWWWRGQTVGKRILRLRVIDAFGLRLQFHQVVMRNLLRVVDMLPAFYLLGGIVSLISVRAQRLGDLAAGTVVIRQPKTSEPDLEQLLAGKFNSLREHSHLVARLRQRMGPDEARLMLEALLRREEFEPAARVRLFGELAAHVKERVSIPGEVVEAMSDEQFIRNVVDVLFRTSAPSAALHTGPALAEVSS